MPERGRGKGYWTPLRPGLRWLAWVVGAVELTFFVLAGVREGDWKMLALARAAGWIAMGLAVPAFKRTR